MNNLKSLWWVSIIVLATFGCSKAKVNRVNNANHSNPGVKAGLTKQVSKLLDAVPASAIAVAFVDTPEPAWNYLKRGVFLSMHESLGTALEKELGEFLDRTIGIRAAETQGAVLFLSMQEGKPLYALLIPGVTGKIKAASSETHNDTQIFSIDDNRDGFAAHFGTTVVMGAKDAVILALDTVAQKKPSLREHPWLYSWLRKQCGGYLGFAATLKDSAEPQLRVASGVSGIDRVSLCIDSQHVAIVADGNGEIIGSYVEKGMAMANQGLAKMRKEVDQAKAQSKVGEAIVGIYGYHQAVNALEQLKPTVTKDRVELKFAPQFEASYAAIPTIGILSAVAIPAFLKYKQKAEAAAAQSALSQPSALR